MPPPYLFIIYYFLNYFSPFCSPSQPHIKPKCLQVVKVADFGVARVQAQSGVMTAETGTYRWMAPEVCIQQIYTILYSPY